MVVSSLLPSISIRASFMERESKSECVVCTVSWSRVAFEIGSEMSGSLLFNGPIWGSVL